MSIEDDRIEQLKRKLYSRTEEPVLDVRSRVNPLDDAVTDAWGETTLNIPDDMATRPTHPLLKKFLWVAGIFFVLSILISSYIFFGGGNLISSNNVDITVAGASQVASGEEVDLNVTLINRNATDLNLAQWTVDYPDGTFADQASTQTLTHQEESIGTVAKGSTVNRTIKLFIFGDKGVTKTVKMMLKYQVAGSNAIFSKEKDYDVTIASSPIIVTVLGPQELNSGQDATFKATVTSNSTAVLRNVLVVANYPYGFTYESSSLAPVKNKTTIWNLGDLKSGDTKTFSITGKMVAQDGEQKTFQFAVGTKSADPSKDIDAVLSQATPTVLISKPSLATTVTLSGSTGDSVAVPYGQSVSGQVSFSNAQVDALNNVSVQVALSGSSFAPGSVTPGDGGFYQSGNGTITWDKNSNSSFATLNPGDNENVSFSFATIKPAVNAKNPEVDVTITVTGTHTSATGGTATVTSAVTKKVLINANLLFGAKTLRGGPFTNTGPIPPRANSPTTYTVDWALSNTWNDVSGGKVSATLPPYVDWVGSVSPNTENITYDAGSRTVTWTPDAVSAGSGFVYPPKEVFFQLKLNTSLSQVGSAPNLTLQGTVSGSDTFSSQTLSFVAPGLTTQTSDTGDAGIVTK